MRLDYPQTAPSAAQALFALEKAVSALPLDRKISDLVRIRVSQLNGCLFCVDMHVKEARKHEERELRLHHLAVWRESALFTDKEKAALEWAEQLTRPGAHGVEDSAYESARSHFGEEELVALTFVVTTVTAWNRLGVAFRRTPGSLDKVFGLDTVKI